jgi:hypothetical protein
MTDPNSYHTCDSCEKLVLDVSCKRPRSTKDAPEAPRDIFFLNATLADALRGAASGCKLFQWLVDEWTTEHAASFAEVRSRAAVVDLCADALTSTFYERYPVDEMM